MNHRRFLKSTSALVAAGLISSFATVAEAQQADEEIEAITVTGSYIRRRSINSPSPISVLGRAEFDEIGAVDINDIIKTMNINSGSEFAPDAFTQNATTGTGNFNLRGLGLNSTLVLINGKRTTTSSILADDGSSFVDTNSLIPLIAVERVEILKDGAAALYGTDAVAGVVNFITRGRFEGMELRVEGQKTTRDSQKDGMVSGIFGAGNGTTHVVMAFSVFDRTELRAGDRSKLTALTGLSTLGQPGAFVVPQLPVGLSPQLQGVWSAVFDSAGLVPGLADIFEPLFGLPAVPGALTPAFTDFRCPGSQGSIPPATFPIGTCNYDFTNSFTLVPKESRFQGYAQMTHQITDDWEAFGEFAFSRNRALRGNSPSFPLLSFPGIPAANPFNIYGVNVNFLGRLIGGDANAKRKPSNHRNDTFRGVGGFRGELDNGWYSEISTTYSTNNNDFRVWDQITSRVNNAFAGLGGPLCNTLSGTPGVGECMWLSPNEADNSQELMDFITGQGRRQARTVLLTVDAHVTGDLIEMPGGTVGFASGIQFRRDEAEQDWDNIRNAGDFVFLLGSDDYDLNREVWAWFGELSIPVLDNLEIQAALRYEDYSGGVGDTWDPKVAVLFQPLEGFSLRASFGTSFRAPSLHQAGGSQTSLGEIIDPATASRVFRGVRSAGNPNLKPETADVFNVGLSFEPVEGGLAGFTFNADYWRFEYSNLITREQAQAIVNADPFDPRIVRSATGDIQIINIDFINAASLVADGIDVSASYLIDMGDAGSVRVSTDWTFVNKFDIQERVGGPVTDGAGNRNFLNFARTMPEWRGNVGLNWLWENHSASAWVRYTDSYNDDQNNVRIRSHTTVDLQYNYALESFFGKDEGTTITFGAINVADRDPPRLETNGGFDSKIHDPRGRLIYVKLIQGF